MDSPSSDLLSRYDTLGKFHTDFLNWKKMKNVNNNSEHVSNLIFVILSKFELAPAVTKIMLR